MENKEIQPGFFIQRPIFATVISIIITLVGLICIQILPVERYPNLTPPQVSVTATYNGADAETIAQNVASILESAIFGVDDMIYMNSVSSSAGYVNVTVTFAIGTDPDLATINVNNKVQTALAQLPTEVQQLGITVTKRNPSMLMIVALSSPDNSYSKAYLANYASLNVEDELKQVDGVGEVSLFGKDEYSIYDIQASHVILAIGHSSRDTFHKLYEIGVCMEKKNFSVGVRIEHLQEKINKSQYGNSKLHLPPAEYKLAYHLPNGRSCYTFCMCPGGVVIASSSEENTIVTNGMSNFLRDGKNANSAVLVNVTPDDFPNSSPLAGIYFQKDLEEKAFVLGGKNYYAPIQRVGDFLNDRKSEFIGEVKPTYLPGVTLSNLQEILPDFVTNTLKASIPYFATKLKEFANPDSILTGVETRSSSPVKILRDNNLISNILGLYPCGEGAGYAGRYYVCCS